MIRTPFGVCTFYSEGTTVPPYCTRKNESSCVVDSEGQSRSSRGRYLSPAGIVVSAWDRSMSVFFIVERGMYEPG